MVNYVFAYMLRMATKDGGKKRARGEKLPWYVDHEHEAAIFSHLNKWKHGETQDPESGSHPLVHLAWRALAIAYQETYGEVEPSLALFLHEEVPAQPEPEAEQDPPEGSATVIQLHHTPDVEG